MSNQQTIIITRPEPHASELASLLRERDFKTVVAPLIEFVANPEFAQQKNYQLDDEIDIYIFVSRQAVNYFLQNLDSSQTNKLKDKTIISVGKGTQDTLLSHNVNSEVPETYDSEGMLALIKKINSSEKSLKVALICGNEGRKLLTEELSQKHQVKRVEVYQRIGIAQSFPKITEPETTAVIATSEQLLNLSLHQIELQQTPQMQTSDKSLLQSLAFITASSRIEAIAKEKGIRNCLTANTAINEDLVDACLNWRESLALDKTHSSESTKQNKAMSETEKHDNEIIEALELEQELDQEPNSNEPNSKKKGGLLKPLFWLMLLGAIGYGGYWIWNQNYFSLKTSTNEVSDNPDSELTRIVNLEKQLKQQNSQIEQLISNNQSQLAQSETQSQELNRQIESLQQQLVASQRKFQSFTADAAEQARDWQIAEAEYLVRQAAQKVHYSDDTNSIIALLEAADQQILASGDSNLLPLRRAISQDIAQIKSNVAIDIDGILVKLDTISSQLNSLTLASVKFDKEQTHASTEEAVEDPSAWQTFKTNVKDTFSDYYKVHNYDQSVKPFISPQQADLLQQNLLLAINTAQLSVLRHQQNTYDQSIADLSKWVGEYYKQDTSALAILDQLKLLSEAKVSIKLPNKLSSLDFIKQNNQDRLNQWLQSPTLETQKQNLESKNTNTEETQEPGKSGNIDAKIQDALQRMNSDKKADADKSNGEQQ